MDKSKKILKNIKQTKDYFERKANGELFFDAVGAKKAGVDKKVISKIQNDLKRLEEFKKNKQSTDRVTTMADCPGITHLDFYYDVYFFDNCITKDTIFLIQIEAGAVTIAGALMSAPLLPFGTAMTITGVLMGIGAAYLSWLNEGRGIYIDLIGENEVYAQ